MNAWFHLQARVIRSFAIVLMLAGVVSILYAAGLFGWQCAGWLEARRWVPLPARLAVDRSVPHAQSADRVMQFIPELRVPAANGVMVTLLDGLPLALFPALLGIFALSLGRSLSVRQAERLNMANQLKGDRLRRRREYLKAEARVEPW